VFCHSKAKNAPEEHRGQLGYGDDWTWTAICADAKLVPSWLVGERNGADAAAFIDDLGSRLSHRVQLRTDGHKPYLEAVEGAFGGHIDYAILIKEYGPDPAEERRYGPPQCIGTETRIITGDPHPDKISTSYVERQNLTMRMGMRRFTRLTNAFSKKLENLNAAVALHFMSYIFARVHMTLKTTPAVAAGVADHERSVKEIGRCWTRFPTAGQIDPLPTSPNISPPAPARATAPGRRAGPPAARATTGGSPGSLPGSPAPSAHQETAAAPPGCC
jgi:IS1 family transposase